MIKEGLADELHQQINQQLAQKQLKVAKAQTAIVDATIIQTAGGKLKKSIEINENEEVIQAPASKDKDAKWTIKSKHWYLGYKLHARTDEEGFIEQIHVTPANVSDVNHLETVLDKVEHGVKVYADKGYDSQHNREFLAKN